MQPSSHAARKGMEIEVQAGTALSLIRSCARHREVSSTHCERLVLDL
jgi:hypothetical protein